MFRNVLINFAEYVLSKLEPESQDVTNESPGRTETNSKADTSKFVHAIEFCKSLMADHGPVTTLEHPIYSVILALGRGRQYSHIADLIKGEEHLQYRRLDFNNALFKIHHNSFIYDLIDKSKGESPCSLKDILVFPWPWNRYRLERGFKNIKHNNWVHDPQNHDVTLIQPLNIAFVDQGNHSLAIGILRGEGVVNAKVWDISKLYDYIHCDGVNFRIFQNAEKSSYIDVPIHDPDFATIFEIGRLIAHSH